MWLNKADTQPIPTHPQEIQKDKKKPKKKKDIYL